MIATYNYNFVCFQITQYTFQTTMTNFIVNQIRYSVNWQVVEVRSTDYVFWGWTKYYKQEDRDLIDLTNSCHTNRMRRFARNFEKDEDIASSKNKATYCEFRSTTTTKVPEFLTMLILYTVLFFIQQTVKTRVYTVVIALDMGSQVCKI